MAYFVLTTLRIKYGNLSRLTEVMNELVPDMRDRGWTLKGAYYPVIGNFHKVTHVWEIKDIESLQPALEGLDSRPKIVDVVKRLAEFVEEEELQLAIKTPYSP